MDDDSQHHDIGRIGLNPKTLLFYTHQLHPDTGELSWLRLDTFATTNWRQSAFNISELDELILLDPRNNLSLIILLRIMTCGINDINTREEQQNEIELGRLGAHKENNLIYVYQQKPDTNELCWIRADAYCVRRAQETELNICDATDVKPLTNEEQIAMLDLVRPLVSLLFITLRQN